MWEITYPGKRMLARASRLQKGSSRKIGFLGKFDIPGQWNALCSSFCPDLNVLRGKGKWIGRGWVEERETTPVHLIYKSGMLPGPTILSETWTWVWDVSEWSRKEPKLDFPTSIMGSLEGIRNTFWSEHWNLPFHRIVYNVSPGC